MPAPAPSEVRNLINKVMRASPGDIRLMARRLHDHAFEQRLTPEATREFIRDLGYRDLHGFCADIGLPPHIAERWERFGVSAEMKQVFALLVGQRRKMAQAIAEFEEMTHVGIDDFLRERGLI